MGRLTRLWLSFERTRRSTIVALLGSIALGAQQEQPPSDDRRVKLPDLNDDPRLPDGRSQKNAIAKEQHERALREANQLLNTAEQLRDQLRQASEAELPESFARKTDEIEKLARRIRARLKF